MWVARYWQPCAITLLIRNIGQWALQKNWVGTFLVQKVQPKEKTSN